MTLEEARDVDAIAKAQQPQGRKWKKAIEISIYLGLWYFFSGWYNIYNKQALNILKLPWFVATAQMGMGFLIFLPMWMLKLRERPASDLADFKSVLSSLLAVGFYQVMQFPVIDFLFIYIYLLLA